MWRQVVAVNGEPVLNLRQLYAHVQKLHAAKEFVSFEVYCAGGNAIVTSSTAAASEALELTMRLYRIPSAASPELDASPEQPAETAAAASAHDASTAGSESSGSGNAELTSTLRAGPALSGGTGSQFC